MVQISIRTTALLMGRTPRTVWRRVADGALQVIGRQDGDRTMIEMADVVREACVRIEPEDFDVIVAADAGRADALCDLALIFLMEDKPEPALQLFAQAARQHYAEAYYQIARCHIAGTGVAADVAAGLAWLEKAADAEHVIAGHQIAAAREAGAGADPKALDALLESIEQRVVLDTLNDTAK